MRIAIIADRLVMGGLETHIITSVNELLRRGHSILLNTAYIAPEILSQIEGGPNVFKSVEWSADAAGDLSGFDPEIIHSHPFSAIFRGFEVAKTLEKPFFVTMHGLYDFGLDRSSLGNQVCDRVKAIIAVDQRVADLLTGCVSHPEKITVINNGIDTRQFYPLPLDDMGRPNFGLRQDWPTLVVISRMADGKDRPVYQLLDCAPQLADQLCGLNILIVGDGCQFSNVEKKAESIKFLDKLRINLVGRQMDVAKFIAMADLVLACDRAAIEAMACQRTVFAMNVEGFAGVINYDNYRQVLLKRSGYHQIANKDLVSAIIRFLRNQSLRQKLANDGLEIVRQYFDSRQMVSQLESVYYKYS